jgi:tripeptide aminopeptidase
LSKKRGRRVWRYEKDTRKETTIRSVTTVRTYDRNWVRDRNPKGITEDLLTVNSAWVDVGLFHRLLVVQSESGRTRKMLRAAKRELLRMGATVIEDKGNLYAVKGEAEVYPCVVAHLDTVHDMIGKHFRVRYDHTLGEWFGWDALMDIPHGIGGDDKVGIFVALSVMQQVGVTIPACKVALFRDEEVGCLGSSEADMGFFENASFVLQADRQGFGDFVHRVGGIDLHDEEFWEAAKEIAESYGYAPSPGAMTDVQQLKENGLAVAAMNLACGYHLPHTSNEYVRKDQLEVVTHMAERLCRELGVRVWPHTADLRDCTSWGRYGTYTSKGWENELGDEGWTTWDKEKDEWVPVSQAKSVGATFRRGTGEETRIASWRQHRFSSVFAGMDWDRVRDLEDQGFTIKTCLCPLCRGGHDPDMLWNDLYDVYWCFSCADYAVPQRRDWANVEEEDVCENGDDERLDEEVRRLTEEHKANLRDMGYETDGILALPGGG